MNTARQAAWPQIRRRRTTLSSTFTYATKRLCHRAQVELDLSAAATGAGWFGIGGPKFRVTHHPPTNSADSSTLADQGGCIRRLTIPFSDNALFQNRRGSRQHGLTLPSQAKIGGCKGVSLGRSSNPSGECIAPETAIQNHLGVRVTNRWLND